MINSESLARKITEYFGEHLLSCVVANDEVTIEVPAQHIVRICEQLRDQSAFQFAQLMDLCGVDYQEYGKAQWSTDDATATGFSRGVSAEASNGPSWERPRFALVYHLLSVSLNQRLRIRTYPEGDPPMVASVTPVFASADWYEREAFDLFGILFMDHPDLRRLLTDYGFVGHPFRKDFPLSGEVEVRYDPQQQRVVYQPVSIEPRTLVPKVIRAMPHASDADSATVKDEGNV